MRWLSLITLCLFAFVACGGEKTESEGKSEDPSSKTKEIETVIYAGSQWPGHAPVWVGMQKGIFKEAGFEIELKSGGTSSARIDLLSSNSSQFSSLGQVAMLGAMDKGNKEFYFVGNQNIAPGNEGIVARDDIKTVADLKGKKVAVTFDSSTHITLADRLKDAGLSYKDVEMTNAAGNDLISLLEKGNVDAALGWEPYFSGLKALPNTHVLATDDQTTIFEKHGTMTGPDCICVSREWLDADKDRAKRFFKAYFKAVTWCKENPEELITLVAKHIDKSDKVEDVKQIMGNFKWNDWDDQKKALNSLRAQSVDASALLVEMGRIKTAPAIADWMYLDMYR